MERDKKKIGIIIGLVIILIGIIAYIIYRDDKTFNERIETFKKSVKNFFSRKKKN